MARHRRPTRRALLLLAFAATVLVYLGGKS